MKVTFLIPPVLDGTADVDRCFGCNYCIYFLPLLPALYAATLLKGEVEAVSILDFPANKKTAGDFKNFVAGDDSQVYVFYTVYLCQKTDLIARQILRQAGRNARFIFCGPQASYSPEAFIDAEDTFAVRGEPEFVIRDLVRVLKSRSDLKTVKGISYRRGSEIIHNPYPDFISDIDLIPIPDRTLLDHKAYFNPKLHTTPHTAALTSRGCFGQCWFCVPNSLSYARELEHKKHFAKKPPPRLHCVERVIKEFTDIAEQGFRSVSIIDDEFLWDEQRTCAICDGIKGLGLEWSCLARPDMVTEGAVKAMAAAGCAYVDMGTESFSREILADIKKDMRPEDTRRAVELLKKYKIEIELNVLFGASPKETEESIKYTIREAKRLDVDYVLFSITNPFPGTDFYQAAKKEGWMFYGDYVPVDSAKNAIISYPHLSKRKLEQLCSYAYLSYYLNPRYIFKQMLAIKSPKDLANKFFTFLTFLKKNFLKRC